MTKVVGVIDKLNLLIYTDGVKLLFERIVALKSKNEQNSY